MILFRVYVQLKLPGIIENKGGHFWCSLEEKKTSSKRTIKPEWLAFCSSSKTITTESTEPEVVSWDLIKLFLNRESVCV